MLSFIQKADLIVNGYFIFDRQFDMESDERVVYNKPIDWRLNPFGDEEWNYMLNRMEYLIDIAVAYNQTKDIKYKRAVEYLINDWIEKNSLILEEHRTIDTGLRLFSWAEALSLIEIQPNEKIRVSINTQVDSLTSRFRLKDELSNWGIFQSSGVLANKSYLEQEQMNFWQQKLKDQLRLQINNEGFHWENSIMYHNQVLLLLCRLQNMGLGYNFNVEIDKLAIATHLLMKPNGNQIMQNDSDDTSVVGLLQFASQLTGNTSYLVSGDDQIAQTYCQQSNNDDNINDSKFKVCKDVGLGVKSCGDTYLSIHNHPYGSSHSHIMPCHLNFYKAQDILVDPGRYSYCECEQRRELKSIYNHNSPIVHELLEMDIKNSWDTSANVNRHRLDGQDLDILTYFLSSYVCDDRLIIRHVFLIGGSLLVCDKYPKTLHNAHVLNLVFHPDIKVDESLKIADSHYLKHSYQQSSIKKTMYSAHYNQLQTTAKIVLTSDTQGLKYFSLIENDATVYTREEGEYLVFDIKNENTFISVCMLEADIMIGPKITKISGFNIYGKIVVIDHLKSKVYQIEQ